MCLILFAHRASPRYRLIVAANRDEWFYRPTAPAEFWPDAPDILAGRDLEQRGTWLGITRTGRFAALTNFRDPGSYRVDAPSRGALVSGFLQSTLGPAAYLDALRPDAPGFNPFSLLVGDGASLWYFSNREGLIRELRPGVYGLSNDLLDVPWPKVRRGKERLAQALNGCVNADALLASLDDRRAVSDDELPATGVTLEWERKLSPMHILADGYGTRSATVLLVGADGEVTFVERSFDANGSETGVVRERFVVQGSKRALHRDMRDAGLHEL
jgi:uncharacterized protein with NRDE domain